MPAIYFAALSALSFVLERLAFRIALGLGFGVATYVGVGLLITDAASSVAASFAGLASEVITMCYLLGLDRCLNLLFSAYTTRMSILGMTALGAISKVVQNGVETSGS